MTKKRIETICITISLVILSLVLNWAHYSKLIDCNPIYLTTMLLCCAVDIFGGCMLQTFGHNKLALALTIFTFFILCACLVYCVNIWDYLVFALSMFLVIRKAVKVCGCDGSCGNLFL